MNREYLEDLLEAQDENNDYTFNINDFDYDEDDNEDYDYYGCQETIRRMKEEMGLPAESRALAIAKEMAEEEKIKKIQKMERERLYKTDKKCYNFIKDVKNCQKSMGEVKDKTEDRIYTRVNIRKIKKLLKYNDITYEMLAEALNVSVRTLIRRFNVYSDLTANELIEIAEILNVDINELIYKNKH